VEVRPENKVATQRRRNKKEEDRQLQCTVRKFCQAVETSDSFVKYFLIRPIFQERSGEYTPNTCNVIRIEGWNSKKKYICVTDKFGSSDSNSELYSGCNRFESRPGHRLSWVRIFVDFPQSLWADAGIVYLIIPWELSSTSNLIRSILNPNIFRPYIAWATDSVVKLITYKFMDLCL
jgi:hypothetical protein